MIIILYYLPESHIFHISPCDWTSWFWECYDFHYLVIHDFYLQRAEEAPFQAAREQLNLTELKKAEQEGLK